MSSMIDKWHDAYHAETPDYERCPYCQEDLMGERVATLETKRGLVTYRSPQEATARAVRLNKKGITLNSLGKMV